MNNKELLENQHKIMIAGMNKMFRHAQIASDIIDDWRIRNIIDTVLGAAKYAACCEMEDENNCGNTYIARRFLSQNYKGAFKLNDTFSELGYEPEPEDVWN